MLKKYLIMIIVVVFFLMPFLKAPNAILIPSVPVPTEPFLAVLHGTFQTEATSVEIPVQLTPWTAVAWNPEDSDSDNED